MSKIMRAEPIRFCPCGCRLVVYHFSDGDMAIQEPKTGETWTMGIHGIQVSRFGTAIQLTPQDLIARVHGVCCAANSRKGADGVPE